MHAHPFERIFGAQGFAKYDANPGKRLLVKCRGIYCGQQRMHPTRILRIACGRAADMPAHLLRGGRAHPFKTLHINLRKRREGLRNLGNGRKRPAWLQHHAMQARSLFAITGHHPRRDHACKQSRGSQSAQRPHRLRLLPLEFAEGPGDITGMIVFMQFPLLGRLTGHGVLRLGETLPRLNRRTGFALK